MKIAIDTGALESGHKVRGVGFYTKYLIQTLGNKVEAVDFRKADLSKYDLVHYPYFDPFFQTLPLSKPTKTVVTIHDVIPLIYPENYPPGTRGKIRFFLQKLSLKTVGAIITDTESSKKDIVRFLGVLPDRIFPIHLAQADHFKEVSDKKKKSVKEKYHLPERFVLYVGDINFNKNIPNLVRACRNAKIPLVICGKQALDLEQEGVDLRVLAGPRDWLRYLFGRPHPQLAHYKELLQEFKRNNKIIRLGFVSDEDLVAIYNLATVYCQPSFYEGFGLPVLEAFACGTPVVAARTQALVEIAGNAALFFNPKDARDMTQKLSEVLNNKQLKESLIAKGKEKVEEYSWQKTAEKTFAVYKRVYEEK